MSGSMLCLLLHTTGSGCKGWERLVLLRLPALLIQCICAAVPLAPHLQAVTPTTPHLPPPPPPPPPHVAASAAAAAGQSGAAGGSSSSSGQWGSVMLLCLLSIRGSSRPNPCLRLVEPQKRLGELLLQATGSNSSSVMESPRLWFEAYARCVLRCAVLRMPVWGCFVCGRFLWGGLLCSFAACVCDS